MADFDSKSSHAAVMGKCDVCGEKEKISIKITAMEGDIIICPTCLDLASHFMRVLK